MLSIEGTTIKLTRGDSATLNIYANNSDKTSHIFSVDDKVTMTVRDKSRNNIFSVHGDIINDDTGSYAQMIILPDHTNSATFGIHIYDVEVEFGGDPNCINTICIGNFEITIEATYPSDRG